MTPEEKVNEFMRAWQRGELLSMVRACQLTWIKYTKLNVTDTLTTEFLGKELLEWKIRKVTRAGEASRDVHVSLSYRKDGRVQKRRIIIRTICETGPYSPSLLGSWGVNPISAMKNLN